MSEWEVDTSKPDIKLPKDSSDWEVDTSKKPVKLDKTTFGQEMLRGEADPFIGAAQLASHTLPQALTGGEGGTPSMGQRAAEAVVGNIPIFGAPMSAAISSYHGGKTPMDEYVEKREKGIQEERGGSSDWDLGRLTGNVVNPINLVGPAAVRSVGAAANFGKSLIGGIIGGLTQPVEGGDFGKTKAIQTGISTAVSGAIGGGIQGVSKGIEKIGEFAARNNPQNVISDAVSAILNRIRQDAKGGGPSAADMIDLVNESKKPLTMTDVGGKGVEGLAGRVARQPGEGASRAQAFVTKRDEGAAQRISQDIAQYVSPDSSVHKAVEGQLAARSEAAKPLYEQTFQLKNVWSPRLEQFLQDHNFQKGLARGYEIESLHALADGRPVTATQLGVDIDTQGNIKLLDKPNMRLLDMAKQGMDAMISDHRDPITGRLDNMGLALSRAREAYVKELDSLDTSGVYKKARAAWAGYSKNMDAIKLGKSVFSGDPEENAAIVKGMSESEKSFYQLGVANTLQTRMQKAGFNADESKQIIKSDWMKQMLRPAFKTQSDFDHFVEAISTETKMFDKTKKVFGGSQTAERVNEDAAPLEPAVMAGLKMVGKASSYVSHPFHLLADTMRLWKDLGIKPSPELNNKMAQILFSPKLDENDAVVKAMRAGTVPPKVNPAATGARLAGQAGVGVGIGGGVGAAEIAGQRQ